MSNTSSSNKISNDKNDNVDDQQDNNLNKDCLTRSNTISIPSSTVSLTITNSPLTTNINMTQLLPRRDRNWLKKLIQKYLQEDVRIQTYHHQRIEEYPILQDKALVLAPMVDQSDLPFRLLCRNYGTNLCFTPMIHAKMLCNDKQYRKKFWSPSSLLQQEGKSQSRLMDRPLIVQLCGSDKFILEQAIRIILNTPSSSSTSSAATTTNDFTSFPIDGIDINCGCPQDIARRGKYGAYLLEQEELLVDLVHHLAHTFYPLPISVKVRLLPTGISDSLQLYTKLVQAGAAMLTIHGRNRFEKGTNIGPANWDAIQQTVQLLGQDIPILANGSMYNLDTIANCIQYTGVDGVMSSEAILEYPALFTLTNIQSTHGKRKGPSRLTLTKEYLQLCNIYPPQVSGQGNGLSTIRAHLFKLLFQDTQHFIHVRDDLVHCKTYEDYIALSKKVEELHVQNGHVVQDEQLSWYFRHWNPNKDNKMNSRNEEPCHPQPLMEKRHRTIEGEVDDDQIMDEKKIKKEGEEEKQYINGGEVGALESMDTCCHDECL